MSTTLADRLTTFHDNIELAMSVAPIARDLYNNLQGEDKVMAVLTHSIVFTHLRSLYQRDEIPVDIVVFALMSVIALLVANQGRTPDEVKREIMQALDDAKAAAGGITPDDISQFPAYTKVN